MGLKRGRDQLIKVLLPLGREVWNSAVFFEGKSKSDDKSNLHLI